MTAKRLLYNGKPYREVKSEKPACDGCIFEYSEIQKECYLIAHPECRGMLRKDGNDIIFKYREVKRRKTRKNGKGNGTAPRACAKRGGEA